VGLDEEVRLDEEGRIPSGAVKRAVLATEFSWLILSSELDWVVQWMLAWDQSTMASWLFQILVGSDPHNLAVSWVELRLYLEGR
jgi:hypothetical protein